MIRFVKQHSVLIILVVVVVVCEIIVWELLPEDGADHRIEWFQSAIMAIEAPALVAGIYILSRDFAQFRRKPEITVGIIEGLASRRTYNIRIDLRDRAHISSLEKDFTLVIYNSGNAPLLSPLIRIWPVNKVSSQPDYEPWRDEKQNRKFDLEHDQVFVMDKEEGRFLAKDIEFFGFKLHSPMAQGKIEFIVQVHASNLEEVTTHRISLVRE